MQNAIQAAVAAEDIVPDEEATLGDEAMDSAPAAELHGDEDAQAD